MIAVVVWRVQTRRECWHTALAGRCTATIWRTAPPSKWPRRIALSVSSTSTRSAVTSTGSTDSACVERFSTPTTRSTPRRRISAMSATLPALPTTGLPGFSSHCIHFLLPSVKSTKYCLRPKGHPYELPRCEYELHKKSFIPRCLYRNC